MATEPVTGGQPVASQGMGLRSEGMTDDTPWEPPLAGTEVEQLIGALERQRATFRWKADGLDPTGLQIGLGPSELTLGGLLNHLALVEDHSLGTKLLGVPLGPPWDTVDWDDDPNWEFRTGATTAPAELYARYDTAVTRARARLAGALAAGGLDQPIHLATADGRHPSLRRLLCDLIEEYARHTGHADLLRELVDGRVGEDPPPGWQPTAGG